MKNENNGQKSVAVSRIGKGVAGLFMVPVGSVLAVAFKGIGIGLPTISALNTLGVTNVPFRVLNQEINGQKQAALAILLGGTFLCMGEACSTGVKRFIDEF